VVEVEIRSPVYNEESGEVEWPARALVRADGGDLMIYGDQQLVPRGLSVVDVATRRRVTGDEDPEVWARNLPHAYRAGDIVAAVLIDTSAEAATPPEEAQVDPPTIPAPPAAVREREATLH
jgi:hypothetical protein